MEKFIFNDNTKLLFIKDNYILVENEKSVFKTKLEDAFYDKLLNMYRKHYIFEPNFFRKANLNFWKRN